MTGRRALLLAGASLVAIVFGFIAAVGWSLSSGEGLEELYGE